MRHTGMETEDAPRSSHRAMGAPRTEATFNLHAEPPTFSTSNGQYGICEHEPRSKADIQAEPHAGLTRAEAAYHYYSNNFPRFERQRIRYNLDKEVMEGTKVPDPALTLPALNVNLPVLTADEAALSRRGGSERSHRSASQRSRRSVPASVRSAKTATTVRSSGSRGANWQNQADYAPGWNPYRTHNGQYGQYLGSADVPWAGGGREVWLLGRGGGQQTSFDSQLFRKTHLF